MASAPYIGMLAIHTSEVHTSELRCMDSVPMYGQLRCMDPPMIADVGVFQVADPPMYGYDYTLPLTL